MHDFDVYCLNAARRVFGTEPVEVQAMASRPMNDPCFAEIDAHLAVTLRCPEGRLAQCFCSLGAEAVEYYRVLGTEGELTVDPGYRFESAMTMRLRRGAEVTVTDFPHSTISLCRLLISRIASGPAPSPRQMARKA